jgi:hypothetical protein
VFNRGMKPRQKRAATNVLNRMQANPDWARQIRERAQLTLEEMGRLCGVTHSSISRWERSITMPDDADEAYGIWVSVLERWAGNDPIVTGEHGPELVHAGTPQRVTRGVPVGCRSCEFTSSAPDYNTAAREVFNHTISDHGLAGFQEPASNEQVSVVAPWATSPRTEAQDAVETKVRAHIATEIERPHISIIPITKAADGSPKRYMIRCNDCLSVPKGEFTHDEAEKLADGHSCADTVDLGTPSEVVR